MITQPLVLAAVIVVVTAFAFLLDHQVPALSKVGASLLVIFFGALLSNTGLVPVTSPVYDGIYGPVTSLSIAWLLLAVDIRDMKVAGARMIRAFGLAVVGTAIGAFLGALVFAGDLGGEAWKLAGTLTGTYSGGSVNFVSVGRALELPDALFSGTAAADNLTTGLWLGATLLLPLWLKRFYPFPIPGTGASTDDEGDDGDDDEPGPAAVRAARGAEGEGPGEGTAAGFHPFFQQVGVSTLDLSILGAVGLVLVAVSEWVGALVPAVPSVLWLTTFALLVGHTPWFQTSRGALQLGTLGLHFFFVVIGIHSRVVDIVAVGFDVFWYTLLVVGVHGVVVYGVGRMLRYDLGTLSVASQAAIGGPSSALAVAVGREWKALILPGVIVGLLGYAVGTYLGLAVAYGARALGVGV